MNQLLKNPFSPFGNYVKQPHAKSSAYPRGSDVTPHHAASDDAHRRQAKMRSHGHCLQRHWQPGCESPSTRNSDNSASLNFRGKHKS
jgi:hypothetical protein